MQREVEAYRALAATADAKVSAVQFFTQHQDQLPTFYRYMTRFCLIYPSSAFAERVFSQVDYVYNDLRLASLEQTLELT